MTPILLKLKSNLISSLKNSSSYKYIMYNKKISIITEEFQLLAPWVDSVGEY